MSDGRKQDNNTGVLFINDKKASDNHPDRKGSATLDGVEYWVSGWVKTPTNGGDKYMSLAFQRKDAQSGAAKPAPRQTRADDDF